MLGPFVRASAAPLRQRRLPPRLGEHNTEIYAARTGLAGRVSSTRLREAGVV